MNQNRSSLTASGIAIVRAIETEKPAEYGEVKRMRRMRRISGEGLEFGIPAGTVQAFLAARSFTRVHDADSVFLHDTYLTGADRSRAVAEGYAIATAYVAEHP